MRRAGFAWFAALVVSVGVAGCDSDETTTVKPKLLWNPAVVDFGERPVLDELKKPVSLLNVGAASLTIRNMRVEGDEAFVLVEPLGELPGGSEREVFVQFTASELAEYAATLLIESDDEDNPSVEIALTGIGSTKADVVIEPLVLDFGRVGESRSKVQRVRVTSTGTADLKIRSIKFSEETSKAYTFVGSTRTPQTLAGRVAGTEDAFAEVTVKFSPTALANDPQGTLILETTSPDHARVEIALVASVNQQPVAVPGKDVMVPPGDRVELDGSESYDPDGDEPLTFAWALAEAPQGSVAVLEDADTPTPSLVTDQPGHYAIELVVTDAAGLSSVPERVSVIAESSERLVVVLTWDHPVADLDLHMRPEGETFQGPKDCYGYQPRPDWGIQGVADDDPYHKGDRLSGWGPETILYENPVDGRYEIVVKYVSAQGSPETAVRATVNVYLYGQIQQQLTRTLKNPGEVWNVGRVAWPTGDVTNSSMEAP